MKLPGPDHPMTVAPAGRHVRVTFNGRLVAETDAALEMREAKYAPVLYVPCADVDMAALTRTDKATHCPYKGDAGYYSVAADGATAENAVWTYDEPYPAVAQIRDHVAFYPDKVTVEAD
jgi:uncharacterized protein (DUF427 family)